MMLVRELETRAMDVSSQMFYEGCLLVLCAVVLACLTLIGLCTPLPTRLKSLASDYGTVPHLYQ